ncbi:hypothetical protein ACRYCC_25445 [Actinomadura scrupuli]|uniref:hypothetical protein n=1 Tax=Actinomadura scrupuli TaxID=559629 RepID=UPI003D95E67F
MRRIVVTALMVGFAASIAGCGGGSAGGRAASAAPSAPSASARSSVPPSGLVLTANRADYLNYLRRVDRRLVVNEDRAVRGGESTCADIKAGMAGGKLLQQVSARFGGGRVKLGKVKAARIVAAAKRWIC